MLGLKFNEGFNKFSSMTTDYVALAHAKTNVALQQAINAELMLRYSTESCSVMHYHDCLYALNDALDEEQCAIIDSYYMNLAQASNEGFADVMDRELARYAAIAANDPRIDYLLMLELINQGASTPGFMADRFSKLENSALSKAKKSKYIKNFRERVFGKGNIPAVKFGFDVNSLVAQLDSLRGKMEVGEIEKSAATIMACARRILKSNRNAILKFVLWNTPSIYKSLTATTMVARAKSLATNIIRQLESVATIFTKRSQFSKLPINEKNKCHTALAASKMCINMILTKITKQ